MGINRESDVAANLQIGPTSLGMVRLYIETEGFELPLDFEPDEAEEIAEELRAAAAKARAMRPAPRQGRRALGQRRPRERVGVGELAEPAGGGAGEALDQRAAAGAGQRRPGSGQRWISASQASARIRPASGGQEVGRGSRRRPPRRSGRTSRDSRPTCRSETKSTRLDLHSTIQISPRGPERHHVDPEARGGDELEAAARSRGRAGAG